MKSRQTRSFATLPISKAAYEEIANKLIAAGYGHVFIVRGRVEHRATFGDESPLPSNILSREVINEEFQKGNVMIDLHGIALVLEQEEEQFTCEICDMLIGARGLCYDCASTPREDDVIVKPELINKGRDKNYYIKETDMKDF